MKAAILRAHGEADQIAYGDWPDPVAGSGDVVIDVRAASLNRRDWWIMRNPARGAAPCILGSDAAGVVRAVGSGVTGVAPGDEVLIYPALGWGEREDAPTADFEIFGIPRQGVFAEQVVLPAECVFEKPAHLSFAEAACIGIAGLTTWRGLVARGGVGAGSTVLVTGAAAGTGTFAIQIAAALGARVYVTTSSEEKLARCVGLGAVGGADWRDPKWHETIVEATGGGVDVAIDSAGGDAWDGILRALRPGGTLVNFGDTAGDFAQVPVALVYFSQLNIHGSTMGSPREFAALLEHLALDRWRPVIDSTFPLHRTADAFRRLDDPARFGKIVLEVS
ncbi:MAG: zinc-binding alcohol dehydrogenase/oxidoreductase [Gaiellaceae bacterium]|nr:zinc-binding alcohol dehydrogenase/oxidoreductase [Gaiellaceae bacterium]